MFVRFQSERVRSGTNVVVCPVVVLVGRAFAWRRISSHTHSHPLTLGLESLTRLSLIIDLSQLAAVAFERANICVSYIQRTENILISE